MGLVILGEWGYGGAGTKSKNEVQCVMVGGAGAKSNNEVQCRRCGAAMHV
jgi:hypothetical protein